MIRDKCPSIFAFRNDFVFIVYIVIGIVNQYHTASIFNNSLLVLWSNKFIEEVPPRIIDEHRKPSASWFGKTIGTYDGLNCFIILYKAGTQIQWVGCKSGILLDTTTECGSGFEDVYFF